MGNKKFIPNEKQIKLLQAMVDGKGKPTITNFCNEAGISRRAYYNWFNNEDFVKWFNKEWDLAMTKKVSWLDRIGLMKSVSDFRYWEAMQMKYGKFKRKEDVTTDDGPITVNIDYGTGKDKKDDE